MDKRVMMPSWDESKATEHEKLIADVGTHAAVRAVQQIEDTFQYFDRWEDRFSLATIGLKLMLSFAARVTQQSYFADTGKHGAYKGAVAGMLRMLVDDLEMLPDELPGDPLKEKPAA